MTFPKELDSADYNILPVKEWFPATSRFIRSSISRIRKRSPSPHLDLDSVEIEAKSFEDEKQLSLQRIRLADLEPNRTDLIEFKMEAANEGIELGSFYKEINDFDQRKMLLEDSLKSISYLGNTLKGCKSLIKEISSILSEDSNFFGTLAVEQGARDILKIDESLDVIEDNLQYPLSVQLDDVYSLTRGLNERIFALKNLDTSISEQKRSCDQLAQIQAESLAAMDRAQGSLANLTSFSQAFDRKIAAKNAEIERRIRRVEETSKDFIQLDSHTSKQLEKWEQISDTFLMQKLKEI